MLNIVQVGDHSPEIAGGLSPKRAAELFAVRKIKPTVVELKALADRFADAVQLLQIAATNESFAGVRSAHLSLGEIIHQTNEMNIGLMHALEAAAQQAQETRR